MKNALVVLWKLLISTQVTYAGSRVRNGVRNITTINSREQVEKYHHDSSSRILQNKQSNANSTSAQKVQESLSCYDPIDQAVYTTSLFMTVHGVDLSVMSDKELGQIEELIVTSYNELNRRHCDPFYRRIEQLEIDMTAISSISYLRDRSFSSSLRFRCELTVSCKGCDAERGVLFSSTASSLSSDHKGGGRKLKTSKKSRKSIKSKSKIFKKKGSASNMSIKSMATKLRKSSRSTSTDSSSSSMKRSRIMGSKSRSGNIRSKDSIKSLAGPSSEDSSSEGDLGPSVEYVCPCVSRNPLRRGPNEIEMELALKSAISLARSQGDLQVVGSVDDVVESQQIDCNTTTNEFRSMVVIGYIGDVASLSDVDEFALETIFRETYNELNFMSCDVPHFRTIKDVRHVGSQTVPNILGIETLIEFHITGECRDCDYRFNIFSHSDSNKSTSPMLEIQTQMRRGGFQSTSTTCFCPAKTSTSAFRAPTPEEFRDAYHEKVIQAQRIDLFPDIILVDDVFEVNEVDCHPTTTEFSSFIWVHLDGTPHFLTDEERRISERAFEETYNALTLGSCDAHFPQITNVQLHLDDARVQQFVNQSSRMLQSSQLPAVFQVIGSCRNCPVASPSSTTGTYSIIGSGFRRSLSPSSGHARIMQRDSDSCVCPVNVEPQTGDKPTKSELLDVYNGKLSELKTVGLVNNIDVMADSPPRVRCHPDVTMLTDAFEVDYDFVGDGPNESPEDLFQQYYISTHDQIQQTLCDPFNRKILDVSCVPIDSTNRSGAMCCETTFSCTGPCEDWLFPEDEESASMHNDINHEFDIFNCTCLNATARAPSEEEIFEAVAQRLGSVLHFHIPLAHTSACFRPAVVTTQFRLRYTLGNTTDEPSKEDYEDILNETNEYFSFLFSNHYKQSALANFLHFRAVIKNTDYKNAYANMLHITYDANLVFTLNSTLPTKQDALVIVENADMLDYLYRIWGRSLKTNRTAFSSMISANVSP